MNAPCQYNTTCPDLIFNNFSAEAPDSIDYPAFSSSEFNPTLGEWWTVNTCFGRCVSHKSPEDAQACADLVSWMCTPGTPPNNNWPPSSVTYRYSAGATGTYACPDGSIFHFTVPAGSFIGTSQAEADARAQSYANEMAAKSRVCLPNINQCLCYNVPYNQLIRATPFKAVAYLIISGALPTGLTYTSTLTGLRITGTPTAVGSYTFTIRAVDGDGNYMDKGYTLYVLNITTTVLPSYTIGSPYSFQLQAVGSPMGYTWSLVSGSLPTGITLSTSGLLSGTPTAAGVNPLRFKLTGVGCL